MRTKRLTAWACTMCVTMLGYSQIEWHANPGGNVIGGGDWLGADFGSTIPLRIQTRANQPIDFSTNNLFRGRINPRMTYSLLNNFSNIPADGFTLLTPDDGFLHQAPKGPFSRLHLAEGGQSGNAEQFGYRPWQRNGITFTGNGDQGYIGQKYDDPNKTDMVVQWSDNPGEWKGDRMRFIFTSAYTPPGPPSGMNSVEGLEGMRLYPKNEKEINVGIGDFYAGHLIDPININDPTERLDVLTGRERIRQLPTDPEANTLEKYMVVDEDGVVWWRHLPVVPPPAPSCDWTLNAGPYNNVSTAYNPAPDPDCPDVNDAVGIGVNLGGGASPAKLRVVSSSFETGLQLDASTTSGNTFGAKISATGSGQSVRGVQVQTYGACAVATAGEFISHNASGYAGGVSGLVDAGTRYSIGVSGDNKSPGTWNLGVRGWSSSNGPVNVGLYGLQGGSIINPPSGNYGLYAATQTFNPGADWAGYFRGNINVTGLGYIPGGLWQPSDENLKDSIADLTGATAVINQLAPKSYRYRVDEFPQASLPTGQQYGFLAQDLQQAIPSAVKPITFSATLDSAGNEVLPELSTFVVDQAKILPFLVEAFKEQNARIDSLEAQLAECCASQGGGMVPQGGVQDGSGSMPGTGQQEDVREQRLVVQPNPFTDHTALRYYVPKAGNVALQVGSSSGRSLGMLREEQAEAGAYSYNWNTANLAPGVYFVSLVVNGEVVVKRAVKVGR